MMKIRVAGLAAAALVAVLAPHARAAVEPGVEIKAFSMTSALSSSSGCTFGGDAEWFCGDLAYSLRAIPISWNPAGAYPDACDTFHGGTEGSGWSTCSIQDGFNEPAFVPATVYGNGCAAWTLDWSLSPDARFFLRDAGGETYRLVEGTLSASAGHEGLSRWDFTLVMKGVRRLFDGSEIVETIGFNGVATSPVPCGDGTGPSSVTLSGLTSLIET